MPYYGFMEMPRYFDDFVNLKVKCSDFKIVFACGLQVFYVIHLPKICIKLPDIAKLKKLPAW
jgi:hypothetical protein